MTDRLDTIYTLTEAAERLRLNKNALARLARRTGHCSAVGRTVLFSEADLLALWEEMRVEPIKRVEKVQSPFKSERDLQNSLEKHFAKKPKTRRR